MRERGFTLIEVIVVIVCVGLLAAILTPVIAKYINDAKLSRADGDIHAMGPPFAALFKDTGKWPVHKDPNTNSNDIRSLHSAAGANPIAGTAQAYPAWAGGAASTDNYENHFNVNNPGGDGAATAYPNCAVVPAPPLCWKGPYCQPLVQDPWGNRYIAGVDGFRTGAAVGSPVWLLSAGPDNAMDTAINATDRGDDDVAYRLQ